MKLLISSLIFAAIASISFVSNAQAGGSSPFPPVEQSDLGFVTPETFPEYPGGMKAWNDYLKKNLKYPNDALSKQIEGRVFVSCLITKDGEIKNVKVVRGLGYGTDEEAVRLVTMSPKWKPGLRNGIPIEFAYTMAIYFRL